MLKETSMLSLIKNHILLTEAENNLKQFLCDIGECPSIGDETGKTKKSGISVYKSPYGSYRYVYRVSGELVSVIQFMSRDGKKAVLSNVYTKKEHRRKGYASKLYAKAKSDFSEIEYSDFTTDDGILFKNSLKESLLIESKKKVTIYKDTLVVDVDGYVDIRSKNLTKIPVKFGKVQNFDCSKNKLESLDGSPFQVARSFYCNENELISLAGSPKEVKWEFNCEGNNIENLFGSPESVGDFYCGNNKLESLDGCPKEVRNFDCSINNLITLDGCPKVKENFICRDNKLESLDGVQEIIDGVFDCSINSLNTLSGSPKEVHGEFICSRNYLDDIDGCPQYVRGFDCSNQRNGNKFTVEEVESLCRVEDSITV
jgi:predicted GNAT family acetyltransferase